MDIITILTKEYNYGADILEIQDIQQDIPAEMIERRSISELITGQQANPLLEVERQSDRYLNI